jgi:hypothetical protein
MTHTPINGYHSKLEAQKYHETGMGHNVCRRTRQTGQNCCNSHATPLKNNYSYTAAHAAAAYSAHTMRLPAGASCTLPPSVATPAGF